MLVGLNNDDDVWNAVLVKTQFHDELRLLSSTLSIATHPASVASWT